MITQRGLNPGQFTKPENIRETFYNFYGLVKKMNLMYGEYPSLQRMTGRISVQKTLYFCCLI